MHGMNCDANAYIRVFLTRPLQVSPVQLTTISRVIGFDNLDFSATKFPGDSNNVTFFYLHTRNGMKSFLTGYESKLGGISATTSSGGFTVSPFGPTAVPSREPFFIYNIPLSKTLEKKGKKNFIYYYPFPSMGLPKKKKTRVHHGWLAWYFWFQPRQFKPANSAG